MFTGIIETQGVVKKVMEEGTNKSFWIRSPISNKLKIDQSVCHDGVCLTVEEVKNNRHRVTAVEETLKKTTLSGWEPGTIINLERCLKLNDRVDGHLVQGHIDYTGECLDIVQKNGSWEFRFGFAGEFAPFIIEKGSVAVNGISLTAFQVGRNSFDVAVIPYTFRHTNLGLLKPGKPVNIEFDMIGKYIHRKLSLNI